VFCVEEVLALEDVLVFAEVLLAVEFDILAVEFVLFARV
jgi:hypothetical protein